jgi:beta-glucanase (GH16 family)
MRNMLFVLVLLMISLSVSAQKYVQVWGDEFNTPGLPDSTKWGYEFGKIRNNELQYYTDRWENARIEDSVLIIEARKENYEGAEYTSASVISKGIGDWLYGKVEISAKVPGGKGTWPALWMMPTYNEYGGWPRSGEIDIMEYVGVEPQNVFFNTHFEGINSGGHDSYGSGPEKVIRNPYEHFIKFEMIWTPEKIEWVANDRKIHEYNKPSDDYRVWPFDKEFYLILNLAYGGNWGGYDGVDDTKLPHKFMIDYVRVYQLQETESPFTVSIDSVAGGSVEISPKMDYYPENTEVTLTAKPDSGYTFKAWIHQSGANPFTFKVVKNTSISPLFKKEYEILTNGTFDKTWNPWNHYVFDETTISYSSSIEDGMFVNNITKTTGTDWHLGFQENGLSMPKGKYLLSFEAFADIPKSLSISVSKNYADWSAIISKYAVITTSMKKFEFVLEMPRDDENVRLFFGIGRFAGKFYIDNISLTRIVENPPTANKYVNADSQKFKIYPNPTSGEFSVQLPSFNSSTEHLLEVFNLQGKLIYQTKLRDKKTIINPGTIQPGIYFIKVTTEAGGISNKLIIN